MPTCLERANGRTVRPEQHLLHLHVGGWGERDFAWPFEYVA
jgi:hypothetical protein